MSAILDLLRLSKRVQQFNPILRARANVAHHYDIDRSFYALFLDTERHYSCAYFNDSDELENAQCAKKRHITAKLALANGQRLLDIGPDRRRAWALSRERRRY
jgi:cyclopropane-fatty-acyl-phospholipid synthase